jgi:hypothetical protein
LSQCKINIFIPINMHSLEFLAIYSNQTNFIVILSNELYGYF